MKVELIQPVTGACDKVFWGGVEYTGMKGTTGYWLAKTERDIRHPVTLELTRKILVKA